MMEIKIPHIRLTKSKKKDSCDLCGENKWDEWIATIPLMLCKECALSNNYDKEKEEHYLESS